LEPWLVLTFHRQDIIFCCSGEWTNFFVEYCEFPDEQASACAQNCIDQDIKSGDLPDLLKLPDFEGETKKLGINGLGQRVSSK
jgi:hypothetical protein